MGTFGILFLVSLGIAIIFSAVYLIADLDAPADVIVALLALIGILGIFIFSTLAAFLDPSRYVVYKKEDNRVWLEDDDGKYVWVDNLNAPDEGNVIYLSHADLKRYHTSIE